MNETKAAEAERGHTSRMQRIYTHPLYARTLAALAAQEKNRCFCRHDEEHFLAVARLSYIRWLEAAFAEGAEGTSKPPRPEEMEETREILYAAALLHDLGRARQYADGTPHEQASVLLARQILPDAGFTEAERERICALIGAHRTAPDAQEIYRENSGEAKDVRLARLFYEADKQSRPCYCCPAASSCNWPKERRNRTISI